MNRITRSWSQLAKTAVAFLFCTAWPAVVLAQKADEASEEGKSYTLGYALVVLGVGLGLMLTLRPIGRTTEIKLPKSG